MSVCVCVMFFLSVPAPSHPHAYFSQVFLSPRAVQNYFLTPTLTPKLTLLLFKQAQNLCIAAQVKVCQVVSYCFKFCQVLLSFIKLS